MNLSITNMRERLALREGVSEIPVETLQEQS